MAEEVLAVATELSETSIDAAFELAETASELTEVPDEIAGGNGSVNKLFFVQKMLDFVLDLNGIEVSEVPQRVRTIGNPVHYNEILEDAITFINITMHPVIELSYKSFVDKDLISTGDFTRHALCLKELLFKDGFRPSQFIVFSTILGGLSARHYTFGVKDAPFATLLVLTGCLLDNFGMEDWSALESSAKRMSNLLKALNSDLVEESEIKP